MKNYLFTYLVIPLLFLSSCGKGQTKHSENLLSAIEFSEKIKVDTSAVILDVRTSKEFREGHLENAINIEWNGHDFDRQIEMLDATKTVYVYCLSGRRSAAAAKQMRSKGFKRVYEMKGGITKWREANLAETMDD